MFHSFQLDLQKKPCKHNDYNKRIQAIYLGNLYAWY